MSVCILQLLYKHIKGVDSIQNSEISLHKLTATLYCLLLHVICHTHTHTRHMISMYQKLWSKLHTNFYPILYSI
uniref:Uncharacterized protein n=1 Tax=Octopus bimaculoides TaxID=37653 RepID=A0A0L8H1X2_OCTBM